MKENDSLVHEASRVHVGPGKGCTLGERDVGILLSGWFHGSNPWNMPHKDNFTIAPTLHFIIVKERKRLKMTTFVKRDN